MVQMKETSVMKCINNFIKAHNGTIMRVKPICACTSPLFGFRSPGNTEKNGTKYSARASDCANPKQQAILAQNNNKKPHDLRHVRDVIWEAYHRGALNALIELNFFLISSLLSRVFFAAGAVLAIVGYWLRCFSCPLSYRVGVFTDVRKGRKMIIYFQWPPGFGPRIFSRYIKLAGGMYKYFDVKS